MHDKHKHLFIYTFCFYGAHTDLLISKSHNFMPTKYFIQTVLSFPICPVSVQWNTRCFSAINQMKWIMPGLRSEYTGTYISRLALFTEPQLLGRSDGRGIRDELARGSKASLNLNPLQALLWCSYPLNQPSFSALCCPTAQLLRSSPNRFVVCAMIWHSNGTHCVELLTDARFLLNNQALHLQKNPLVVLDW